MDSNGIPVCVKEFYGSIPDSKTLIPIIESIKSNHSLKRAVIVADEGMNCAENIDVMCNNDDGDMFSQALRGNIEKQYEDRMFDDSLYTVVNEDYKYQLFDEEYKGKRFEW